jgi:hypothetical protein
MSDIGERGGEERPEEIRVEIEQTRVELSETIDAIQERLSPEHLKEQATSAVREATVGKAEQAVSGATDTAKGVGATMLETIKQNPLPAALAGIGLGWLVLKSRSGGSGGQSSGQLQQNVGETTSSVGETASQAQERAGQVVSSAQETAGQVAGQTQSQVQRLLQERPLAVGGIALALGAAVGLALPETPQEHQVMGAARDRLLEQAKATAQDVQPKVQRVVEEAQRAVQEEAKEQQLTG